MPFFICHIYDCSVWVSLCSHACHSCDSAISVLNYCHSLDKFVNTHISHSDSSLTYNFDNITPRPIFIALCNVSKRIKCKLTLRNSTAFSLASS